MPVKKSKLKVPSKQGSYEAEGLVQVLAVVTIVFVRTLPFLIAGLALLVEPGAVNIDFLAWLHSTGTCSNKPNHLC